MSKGFADQVTLPSGKYLYTGVSSYVSNSVAKRLKLECKTVTFEGQCIYDNINERAHDKFRIQINGEEVSTFLDKIATEEECKNFLEKNK